MQDGEFPRVNVNELWGIEVERHRYTEKEFTKNGVDPEVRRTVFRGVMVLAIVAALIWAYLIWGDPAMSGRAVANPVVALELVADPEYTANGWPIVRDGEGKVVHPEDLGRTGCSG